jgi:hypothetical protein
MALDKQLSSFMPHTVTIAPYSAKNNYGEETYGATRTASAYVEPDTQVVSSSTIDEETRSKTAYIADTSITLRDRITLPDGSTPEIASVATHTYVVGLEHTMVVFK